MRLTRLIFSLCLLTFLCTSGRAQVQIGHDILGNNPNHDIGVSLAISKDGQRVVVGSPGADRPEGHVKVFELSNGEWAQLGQNFGGRGMSTVGQSVAISADGNRLAYSVGGTNSLPGQVRIYVWDGQEWVEETILEGSDGGNDDSFGYALALSEDGNTLVVGTPFRATDEAGANAGGVNVFRLDESWVDITGDFIEGGNNENVGFAVAVSANGNRIAYTSRDGTFQGSRNSGYTVVYDYDGSRWSQTGATFGGNGEFGDADALGVALCMTPDGSRMVVGGKGPSSRGYYRVVELIGDTWTPVGQDYLGAGGDEPRFGETIVLHEDGQQLILSSGRDNHGIYIETLIDGAWTQGAPDITSPQNDLGYALALSGNFLAISQPTFRTNNQSLGAVRVYDISLTTATRRPSPIRAKVWPNPVNDQLNVAGIGYSGGQILDAYGRIVRSFSSGSGPAISTRGLPAGSYFLRLRTDEGWATGRFIRQ